MNAPTPVRDALDAHPFSRDLAPAHREVLASMARLTTFESGAWVLRLGAEADALHLVTSGRAAVELAPPGREPFVVTTVHAGDVLGWSWLVPPHRVHFDVVALDPVTTIAIEAAALRAACEADHELGYGITSRLARVLAARLEATRLQLVDVYGRDR